MHDLVERWPVLVRAAQKTFKRAVDQPRIDLGEIGVATLQPVHGAGRVVLQHDVGGRDQAIEQRAAIVGFQIDGDAALVAVEGREEAGCEADQASGGIATGRLDLDHVGAEIGKDQARGRPHDGVAELEHAQAGERQGAKEMSIE